MGRLIWMAAAGILSAGAALGQPARFRDVNGWKGTVRINGKAAGTHNILNTQQTWGFDRHAEVRVNLDRWDPSTGSWVGTVEGAARINDHLTTVIRSESSVHTLRAERDVKIDTLGGVNRFALVPDDRGQYSFYPIDGTIPARAVVTAGGTTVLDYERPEAWAPGLMNRTMYKVPESGFRLQGTSRIQAIFPFGLMGAPPPEIWWELEWSFEPVGLQDLEVLIEPDSSYPQWIPEGTQSENEPGNDVKVRATIRSKDGRPMQAKVRRFRFELDSSREPGVALNFPLKAPAGAFDLGFDESRNPGFQISRQRQRAETTDSGATEATVNVSAYDWGAWGKLTVTAILEDSREIRGTYNKEPELRLPRRDPKSFIADAWKEQTGVTEADHRDADAIPAGGACLGDGLTVYEEYRGFFENGRHLRTDPRRKDLFVRDEIGARAKPGIAVFAAATGLTVHHELTEEELLMFPEPHVINLNHRQGPHIVDQHGVVLVETDRVRSGALAWSERYPDKIGTPKTVDLIGVSLTLGQPKNNGKGSGPISYYDKAVAHEMAHAVAVWHHGESDYGIEIAAKMPEGGLSPRLHEKGSKNWLTVLDEKTGVDALAHLLLAGQRAWRDIGFGEAFSKLLAAGNSASIARFYVGSEKGQHSGHEECLMRYEFAELYEKKGVPDTYHIFEGQRRGVQFCQGPEGTGANAPAHTPQSRHGAAASGRGGCRHMVCVSDNYDAPQRPVK